VRKPGLLALLSICAAMSVADAQTTVLPTPVAPRPVRAAEMQWTAATSALIILAGVVAIARGRRKG